MDEINALLEAFKSLGSCGFLAALFVFEVRAHERTRTEFREMVERIIIRAER